MPTPEQAALIAEYRLDLFQAIIDDAFTDKWNARFAEAGVTRAMLRLPID